MYNDMSDECFYILISIIAAVVFSFIMIAAINISYEEGFEDGKILGCSLKDCEVVPDKFGRLSIQKKGELEKSK